MYIEIIYTYIIYLRTFINKNLKFKTFQAELIFTEEEYF